MTYETIVYQKRGRIASITLNRPQTRNSIDARMNGELADACDAVKQDDEINVVILKAAGKVFSAGEDPGQWVAAGDAARALASIECVVIAAINGDAWGEGLELALACDIRIASENATFCFPHARYGLVPRGGGTQRLPRAVGRGKALEMLLTAEPIDAQEALRTGLVSKVVPPGELLKDVEELAERIAPQGRIALMYTKEAVNRGADLALEQGLKLEADLYFLIQTTEDRMEGIRSFLEKRRPEFRGR